MLIVDTPGNAELDTPASAVTVVATAVAKGVDFARGRTEAGD